MRTLYWLAFTLIAPCLGVIVYCRPISVVDPRVLPPSAVNDNEQASNILPCDYTGPETCGQCHEREYKHWSQHPHRFMNQLPHKDSVKGDFSDHILNLAAGNAEVKFVTEGDSYLMSVKQQGQPRKRYKVTRTVGSRFMQFYIGVQIEGPEPPDSRTYTTEHKLPFGYWFRLKRWLPVGYFDRGDPEPLVDGVPQTEGVHRNLPFFAYTQHCLHCHNTYPYAFRIFRPDLVGFPDATVAAAVEPLCKKLSTTVPVEGNVPSLATAPARLNPDKDLVTMGISCESCHLGGRDHAVNEMPIHFGPISRFIQVHPHDKDRPLTGDRKNAATSLGTCAQCHSANVPEYPNGAGIANSREATDMHKGACASQIRCVDCHDPHTASPPSGGATVAKHVQACVRCHEQYREPEQAAVHAHHPATAKVDCLDCHMPRYNQGLDEVVHTHRIAVPVEKTMAGGGFANACNLCHLDKSLNWTLNEIQRGWGKKIEPASGWADGYGGSLDRAVGEAWLNSRDAMTRLVGTQAYARSPLGRDHLPEVLRGLNDPVPVNRAFAVIAGERLLDQFLSPRDIDILAPPARREEQVDALLAEWYRRKKR